MLNLVIIMTSSNAKIAAKFGSDEGIDGNQF
jgi:hypothetical protein